MICLKCPQCGAKHNRDGFRVRGQFCLCGWDRAKQEKQATQQENSMGCMMDMTEKQAEAFKRFMALPEDIRESIIYHVVDQAYGFTLTHERAAKLGTERLASRMLDLAYGCMDVAEVIGWDNRKWDDIRGSISPVADGCARRIG